MESLKSSFADRHLLNIFFSNQIAFYKPLLFAVSRHTLKASAGNPQSASILIEK